MSRRHLLAKQLADHDGYPAIHGSLERVDVVLNGLREMGVDLPADLIGGSGPTLKSPLASSPSPLSGVRDLPGTGHAETGSERASERLRKWRPLVWTAEQRVVMAEIEEHPTCGLSGSPPNG